MTPHEAAWDEYQRHSPYFGLKDEKQAFGAGWDAAMRFAEISPDMQLECASAEVRDLAGITPEDIYRAYPLHVGKQAALKAIKNAIKREHIAPAVLLAITQQYAAAVAQWPEAEKKYTPMPASWFNAGRYDDDQTSWVKGKPVYQSQFSTSH